MIESLFTIFDRVMVIKRPNVYIVELERFNPQSYGLGEDVSLVEAIHKALDQVENP